MKSKKQIIVQVHSISDKNNIITFKFFCPDCEVENSNTVSKSNIVEHIVKGTCKNCSKNINVKVI